MKKELYERILRFFEKTKKDRKKIMVDKKFINDDDEYSEKLWNEFREKWFKNEL